MEKLEPDNTMFTFNKFSLNAVWRKGEEKDECDENSDDWTILYQDAKHPQFFCLGGGDYNSLGYYVDTNEVMIINKYTQKRFSVSLERMYGVWTIIPTPSGSSWNFALFKTYEEAIENMHIKGE